MYVFFRSQTGLNNKSESSCGEKRSTWTVWVITSLRRWLSYLIFFDFQETWPRRRIQRIPSSASDLGWERPSPLWFAQNWMISEDHVGFWLFYHDFLMFSIIQVTVLLLYVLEWKATGLFLGSWRHFTSCPKGFLSSKVWWVASGIRPLLGLLAPWEWSHESRRLTTSGFL